MRRIVLVAVLVLAACTGPQGSPSAPERAAQPVPERYVALGDSLATGAGAEQGYAARYAERLDALDETPVRFANLARDGWTSADLLAALRDDPPFAEALADADVVTVNIGGNDLLGAQHQVLVGQCGGDTCLHEAVERFATNWEAILVEVVGVVPGEAVVTVMDIYNPFVADLQALGVLERLQPFLDAVNEHIRESAARHGMALAPVHDAFNGEDGAADPVPEGLIAPDRLHPSDAGHAAIAELLVEATGRRG